MERKTADECQDFATKCAFGWLDWMDIDDFVSQWRIESHAKGVQIEYALFGSLPDPLAWFERFMAEGNGVLREAIAQRIAEVAHADRGPLSCASAPPYAIAYLGGEYAANAQLCTRDGQETTNAMILWVSDIDGSAMTLTDAGSEIERSAAELRRLYYPPKWALDYATFPGRKVRCNPTPAPAPEARCFGPEEIKSRGPRFRRALDAVASNPSLFPATAFTFLAQYELSPGVVIAALPDITERATIRELIVVAAASERLAGKIVRETVNSVGLSMIRLGDDVIITSPESPSSEISAAIIEVVCGLPVWDS